MNSLSGFEELAIQKMAGESLDTMLVEGQPSKMTRCLAAVKTMREEPKVTLVEAYARAQKLTRRELSEVFRDQDEAADDAVDQAAGEPVTESGKDESPQSEPLASSPSSASEPG